jgi:hypothetical protein
MLSVWRSPLAIPRLSESVLVVGTAGKREVESGPSARPNTSRPRLAGSSQRIKLPAAPVVDRPVADAVTLLPARPVFLPPVTSELLGASGSDRVLAVSTGERVRPVGDEELVKETLQRYGMLRLTVDGCIVRVSGVIATATCRGSARYTPKASSRDPQVESQTWHFTLRKAAAGWQVDAARIIP